MKHLDFGLLLVRDKGGALSPPFLFPRFQVVHGYVLGRSLHPVLPSLLARRNRAIWLEEKLQRDLNHPWAYVRLNLSKGRRFDIADRQSEVSVVQEIEEFSPEL